MLACTSHHGADRRCTGFLRPSCRTTESEIRNDATKDRETDGDFRDQGDDDGDGGDVEDGQTAGFHILARPSLGAPFLNRRESAVE